MSKKYLILGILGFTLILFLSELIYIVHNRPEFLLRYYINRVEVKYKNSQVKEALEYIDNIAKLRESEVVQYYPDIEWLLRVELPDIEMDEKLEQELEQLMSQVDLNKIYEDKQKLVVLFYRIGLIGSRYQKKDLVEYALKKTIVLDPEWSFFHRELANYYLVKGKKKDAWDILKFCEEFKYSKNACKEYFEDQYESGEVLPIGFYEERIYEYLDFYDKSD